MNISRISSNQSYSSLPQKHVPFGRSTTARSSTFSPSSVASFTSLRSASPADRDLETQRRLLGEDAFELLPPGSQPATPSPLFHQTSPLSVASHLQDEFDEEILLNDPFIIDSDRSPPLKTLRISPYVFEPPKSPKRRNYQIHHNQHHRQHRPSQDHVTNDESATSDSCLGLDLTAHPLHHSHSDPVVSKHSTEDVIKSSLRARATTIPSNLPTIQEAEPKAPQQTLSSPKRNITRHSPLTRPSLFPLGPPPEPLPPKRPRYEPPPHIVDIAIEHLRRQSDASPGASPSIRAISPLPTTDVEMVHTPKHRSWFSIHKHEDSESESVVENTAEKERERQWKIWDMERQRALEMTKEAAKGNRPEWGGVTEPRQAQIAPKSPKSFWSNLWCFGASDEQVEGSSIPISRVTTTSTEADEETNITSPHADQNRSGWVIFPLSKIISSYVFNSYFKAKNLRRRRLHRWRSIYSSNIFHFASNLKQPL